MSLIRRNHFRFPARLFLLFMLTLTAFEPALATDPDPKRVVSLAPSITQTVLALDAGSRLAAVSDFCLLPGDMPEPPRLGGLLNVNIEALAKLEPDLLLVQNAQGRGSLVEQWAKRRHIPLVRVAMDSLDDIQTAVLDIAKALGQPQAGRDLVAHMQRELDALRLQTAGLQRPRVFLALGPGGDDVTLFTAGRNAFISQLLDIAGGENVFADLERPWAQVSVESLAARRPEILLEIRPGAPYTAAPWQRWQNLPLPDLKLVRLLRQNFLLIPGPRVTETARLLAETLHPEAF